MKQSLIILAALAFSMGGASAAESQAQVSPPPKTTAVAGPATAQEALTQLKQRLGIQGSAQESAWSDFAKLTLTPPSQDDLTLIQRMHQTKSTPELFGVLDQLQQRGQQKYAAQRDTMVGLYKTLNPDQRAQFDGFVLGTMGSALGALRR